MSKLYIPLDIQRFTSSGTIDIGSSANGKLIGRIVWTSSSNGSTANSTNITVRIQIRRDQNYCTGTFRWYFYVTGYEWGYTGTWYGTIYTDWVEIASISTTIGHNNDGTSPSVHIGAVVNGPSGTTLAGQTVEGSWDGYLDTIPRYFSQTPSISSTSVTETGFKVNWTTSETRDWSQYSLNGGAWTDAGDSGNKSGTINFTGLNANTSYTVKCRFRRADSGLWSESNTITVKTYAYPYLTNASNFTVGNDNTIIFYNPLKRNVTIDVQANGGSWYGRNTSTGTSITGYKNENWRNYWYQNCTSKASNTYRVRLTYGSHTNTTGYSYTYTISESANNGEAKPTFTDFDCEDINSSIISLTGDSSKVVLGYSNVQVTIPANKKAIANKYASMSSYKMAITGNNPTTVNYISSDSVNMTISAVRNNSVTVTAYDSRGFSRSVTKSLTNVGYTSPVIDTLNATLTRNNNGVGEQVTLSFSGTYWNQNFGIVTNTIKTLTYNYKTTSDSNWHYAEGNEPSIINDMTTSGNTFSYNHLIAGPTQSQGFDISTTYNIKVNYTDELSSGSFVLTLGAGTPKIAIAENGVAIGGKYDDNKGGNFQLNGERFDTFATNTIAGGVKLRVSNGILYIRTDGNDA